MATRAHRGVVSRSADTRREGINVGDTLTEGQKLEKGDSLTSNNGAYTLTLQEDGNLVLAARGAGGVGDRHQRPECGARRGAEGRQLRPVHAGQAGVAQRHQGRKDVKLVLQDDRNLVLYATDGPAWSSKTQTDEPPPPAPEAAAPEVAPAAAEEPAPAAAAPHRRHRHRRHRRPLRGPTPWCPVTRCGRSPSGSTATAASTR